MDVLPTLEPANVVVGLVVVGVAICSLVAALFGMLDRILPPQATVWRDNFVGGGKYLKAVLGRAPSTGK
ncbi:hypothetical protein BCR35DRAFT_298554 [Leucosporidium creatinivorum]|uniref:Magnesium transporter n=1 Tax=Leucosporidium creatinivorum TaxID=106004 RepID=A0A1Y2G4Q2_9BASI|nr:hypothetical protein BCR35DRAFT_298554 [Leucosporidium creatinivorum]